MGSTCYNNYKRNHKLGEPETVKLHFMEDIRLIILDVYDINMNYNCLSLIISFMLKSIDLWRDYGGNYYYNMSHDEVCFYLNDEDFKFETPYELWYSRHECTGGSKFSLRIDGHDNHYDYDKPLKYYYYPAIHYYISSKRKGTMACKRILCTTLHKYGSFRYSKKINIMYELL